MKARWLQSDEMRQALFTTERLAMRNIDADDAPVIQRLAGDRVIAENTLNIPHPYEDGMAEIFIVEQREKRRRGELFGVAITFLDSGEFIGIAGLKIQEDAASAELGYWVGKPWWGQGIATEATRALVDYGFQSLKLKKIHAQVFSRNPASRKVLEKIGMRHEGRRPKHLLKWGVAEDIELFGVLRSDFNKDIT